MVDLMIWHLMMPKEFDEEGHDNRDVGHWSCSLSRNFLTVLWLCVSRLRLRVSVKIRSMADKYFIQGFKIYI